MDAPGDLTARRPAVQYRGRRKISNLPTLDDTTATLHLSAGDERLRRGWLLLALGLAAAVCLLQADGNPFFTPGDRAHRATSTVLAHAAVGLLLVASWPCRHRWLAAAARAGSGQRLAWLAAAAALPQLLFVAVTSEWPAYGWAITREWGLAEPLTVACYLAAAWIAAEIGRERERRALEHRPWRMVPVLCVLLALEEMDYLGIPGALIGQVGRVYLGSLHDLVNLAARYRLSVLPLAVAMLAVLGALLRARYLTWTFVREEAPAPSTVPVYLAAAAIAVAEVADVKGDMLLAFEGVVRYPFEEPMELLGSFLLAAGILLKYVRDRAPA